MDFVCFLRKKLLYVMKAVQIFGILGYEQNVKSFELLIPTLSEIKKVFHHFVKRFLFSF